MSTSIAIGKVSESLRILLLQEMKMTPPIPVTILSPDEEATEAKRLNLFLYRILDNAFLRNVEWQPKKGDSAKLVAPPLSLNLFYLLTSYINPDTNTGNADAHGILGEAMRVFYEYAVIPEDYLDDSLKPAYGKIKITPTLLSLDDLGKLWSGFKNPFRLSVGYEVSFVQIDAKAEKARPKSPTDIRILPSQPAEQPESFIMKS